MLEASALIPSREGFHPRFELGQRLWGNFPPFGELTPGEAEPWEAPLPGSVDAALTPVHLSFEALRDEATHARHHARPRSGTPHIDIAIIGVATEPVASRFKFLIQFVQHHIGKER